MSYRKALEKQGFQPSSDGFPGAPDSDAPSASTPVADDSSDSEPVTTFITLDLDLGDCQPCSESDSSASSSTGIDVDVGLDTIGLCLPDVSVLSLPALSGLLAGGECTGDPDATGSTGADGSPGCEDSADSGEASASAQADIGLNVGLNLGDTSAALSSLLNGAPLLGDAAQSDGLLGGVLAGCGGAEGSPGMSVDPAPLPIIDGALDVLVAFDNGDCAT